MHRTLTHDLSSRLVERTLPSLSVVTPTFNAMRHIEACLDSVRSQERDDVEHLIVDGGSTDGTREFVQARALADPRVRLYDGPDSGQSHALNKGVIAARGAIIGILNVDDSYEPGALAIAIEQLRSAPEPSFLWGACEVRVQGPHVPSFVARFTECRDERGERYWVQYPGRLEGWRIALGWDFEPHPANPASYFYHRSLHFVAGLYEEENHYFMDLTFILVAARHMRRVLTTRTILGCFNMAPGSKTYEAARGAAEAAFVSPGIAQAIRELEPRDRLRVQLRRLRWRAATRFVLLARAWVRAKRLLR